MENGAKPREGKLFYRVLKAIVYVSKFYTLILIGVTIFRSVTPAISLLIMKEIINTIQLGTKDIEYIMKLILIYVLMDVFLTIMNSFFNYYNTKFLLKFNLEIKKRTMEKSSELTLFHYENSDTYDVIKRAEKMDGGKLLSYFNCYSSLLGLIVTTLSYIAILMEFNKLIILVILAMPILKYFVINKINVKQFNIINGRTNEERRVWYYNYIITSGMHYKELKCYDLFKHFIDKYIVISKEINNQDIKISKEVLTKVTSLSLVEQVITGVVFSYIIYSGFIGKILLGEVMAYTNATISNQSYIQQILSKRSQIKKESLFIHQYYSFLDLKIVDKIKPDKKIYLIDEILTIKIKNLSFKYDGTDSYVLKNFSLTVNRGETIILVGKNGSGKTTLVKLLMGFYDNYEGDIFINDIELRTIEITSYMKKISSLFQDFVKYESTVRENISYGDLTLLKNEKRLLKIAEMFDVLNIVEDKDKKLDKQLGVWFDDGKQISFGEWQKIALARTFSKDADVIFLDEPNSALDAISDYESSNLYGKLMKDKIGIIIAHKFGSLAKTSNCIVVIEKGRVIESGTHYELINQQGTYRKMYGVQE